MRTQVLNARARWIAWAFAALAMPASVEAAISILPDAFYRADINYPPPARHHFGPGGISVDEEWLSGGGVDLGHVAASAATADGLTPMAAIGVDLLGTGYAAIDGDAFAGLTYYWKVEQIAGTPRSTAKVRIHVEGSVSSALVGDAAASPLYAEAIINFIGSQSIFVAGVKPDTSYVGDSFDATFTKFVGKDSVFSTSLIAYGLAAAGWHDGAGTARMDAFADPLIEIDPEWVLAGDFRVVFSSGVGIAPVPEPATYLLWAVGLVTILMTSNRRRSSIGVQSCPVGYHGSVAGEFAIPFRCRVHRQG